MPDARPQDQPSRKEKGQVPKTVATVTRSPYEQPLVWKDCAGTRLAGAASRGPPGGRGKGGQEGRGGGGGGKKTVTSKGDEDLDRRLQVCGCLCS